MKTLLTSLLISATLLIGCMDDSSLLTSPDISTNPESQSYQLFKLPPKSGSSLHKVYTQTEVIIGKKGGKIKIDEEYVAADGHKVEIEGELKVPKYAFAETDTILITFSIDDEFAAVSFYPHMVFNKPLELDLEFEGLDLEEFNLTEGEYDFVYIDDNGNTELVKYNGIQVKEKKGKIEVHKAALNHFSRYGFTRKTGRGR